MKFLLGLLFSTILFSFVSAQNDCGKLNKKQSNLFNEVMENLTQAKRLYQMPDRAEIYYRQAIAPLKELTETAPEYGLAQYYLGYIYVYRKENNLKIAEKYFKESLELCPEACILANYYLGKIYFGNKQKDLASKHLKIILDNRTSIDDDEIIADADMLYKWSKTAEDLKKNPVPFKPSIVKGISGPLDEYLVNISPDNEIALFTRKVEESNKYSSWSNDLTYKEKFFISRRNKGDYKSLHEAPFDNGEEMPFPFNQEMNEGSPTLTIDNSELVYTVCRRIDQKNPNSYYNCDLYYSKNRNGEWSDIEPISAVNNPDSWESQPSISADGKTLYFISNRKGGIGNYDIYQSTRDENGKWGNPVNVGKPINTAGNEKSPFIHSDSQTLYFSSEGRPGMGGYDIFFSKMDDNKKWLTPKNIGYPINTEFDDVGFIVSTDGKYGYYASNNLQNGVGGWDFYSFDLYEEARPEKVLFIKGNIKNVADNNPIQAKIEIKNIETKEIKEIPINIETGEYVAVMQFNNDYVMTVKKPDFAYESVYFDSKDTTLLEPTTVDVKIEEIEVGKSYQMNDIFYETNSSELTASSKKILDEFIEFLTDNPNIKVKIEGHTDDVGAAEANLSLSENRAKSVYSYLVEHNIANSRLDYQGYGEDKPIADNKTSIGRAKNRRTEFLIIEK